MPVLFEINTALNLVYGAGFGHCTGQELLSAKNRVMALRPMRPNLLGILDIRLVYEFEVDLLAMRHFMAANEHWSATGSQFKQTAFIVRDPSDYHCFDAYTLLAKSSVESPRKVFLGMDEALNWLGLSAHNDEIAKMKQGLEKKYRTSDLVRH